MRVIFSVVGLLIVVAIVGMLARQQLRVAAPAGSGMASQPAAAGTPAQRSQQLQRQVSEDVQKALDQGLQRNESESSK